MCYENHKTVIKLGFTKTLWLTYPHTIQQKVRLFNMYVLLLTFEWSDAGFPSYKQNTDFQQIFLGHSPGFLMENLISQIAFKFSI